MKITNEQAQSVYDVLVREAGAREKDRSSFIHYFTEDTRGAKEFRFMGKLGFGGKCWLDNDGARKNPIFVTFYPEDETAEKVTIRDRTNAHLREITQVQ